jgi:hypothetical protein
MVARKREYGHEKDRQEAGGSRQNPQGQVQGLRGRDDRKGSQTQRKHRPGLSSSGLGGQARQNHSRRLMEKWMALQFIKSRILVF